MRGTDDRRITVRLATASARHPWRAITGWLAFVVLCLAIGSLVGDRAANSADYRVGEAGVAEAMAADGGLPVRAIERVLITARSGRLDAPAALAAGRDVGTRLAALPAVDHVAAPTLSDDRTAVLVTAQLTGDKLAVRDSLPALTAATRAARQAHPALRIAQTGDSSIGAGNDAQRGADLALSEEITLPVTLAILLVVFGAVLAAGVPLVLALTSIAASVGLSMMFSHLVPDAGVGTEVIILMGMAVGVDYSLFYLKREREERRRLGGALDHTTAVRLAAATSGRAIVVSALGVVACTACLYVAGDIIFSSLATAAIVVVLVAMASSVTVLPALLASLGPRVDTPRVPLVGRWSAHGTGRWSARLLRPATRHPVPTLVVAVGAVLALAAPALTMTLNEPGSRTFSAQIPAVATYHRLVRAFPAQTGAHLVVVRAAPDQASAVRAALGRLADRARSDPAFGGVTEPAYEISPNHRVQTLTLHIPYDPTSAVADRSLTRLRALLPAELAGIHGARFAVSGDVAHNTDYVASQTAKTPLVVALVLLMTFVVMVLTFRSVAVGVVAVLLNLLSAAAAFGALTLTFQHHWAERLLDFTSTGFVSARVPLFLFVVLFGLSMDYQIFAVSRIREAVESGLSTRAAVERGITSSAGVITSAAVVMVSVFASFVFLHLLEVKQIGFGLAVAVLVDAVVVRLFVLPALLTLLGRASWWPSQVARRSAPAQVASAP